MAGFFNPGTGVVPATWFPSLYEEVDDCSRDRPGDLDTRV